MHLVEGQSDAYVLCCCAARVSSRPTLAAQACGSQSPPSRPPPPPCTHRYGARLPHFPSFTLESVAASLCAFPEEPPATLLRRAYPHDLLQSAAVATESLGETVNMALDKFSLGTAAQERCVESVCCVCLAWCV